MSKKVSIICIFSIIIFLILGCMNVCNAKVTSTDPTVTSGGNVNITITTSNAVQCFKIELIDSGGLTFVSATRNSTFTSGDASEDKKTINGATTSGSSTTLATYTFKAPEVTEKTTYKVKFSVTGMDNEADNTSNISTVTVNPKSTPPTTTTEPNPQTNSEPEKPKIQYTYSDKNDTVYAKSTVRIRSTDTTNSSSNVLGQLETGKSLKRTGISSNGQWSRVIYNGQTAYISTEYLTTEKPEEQNTNTVANEVTSNTVTNEVTNEVANEITNTVTNEIVDGELDDSKILRLKSLEIKGADISDVFKPYLYEYTIDVDSSVTNLEIEAEANVEGATVEIMGNDNLQQGENIVTIMLKSTDGQVATYQITVNVGGTTVAENQGFDLMYILYILIALIVIVIIAIIVLKIKMNKSEEYDEEYDDDEEQPEAVNSIVSKYKKEEDQELDNKGIFDYDKEVQDDIKEKDDDEEEVKPTRKRGGGKHSKQ